MKVIKKTFFIALTFLTNFVNAQTQLSYYYDASSANRREFSYNITVRIQKMTGATEYDTRYTATLVQASPDSKGFYNAFGDNEYYSCSQLGDVCKPNNLHLISIRVSYTCNGQQKADVVTFRNLNDVEQMNVAVGAGGQFCEVKDFNMKVMGAVLEPIHLGQIMNKINQIGTTNTTQNNSNNNNLTTQTNPKDNQTNETKSYELKLSDIGIPENTPGNDPLSHFESDSKTLSNPMSNNSNGSAAVEDFIKGYEQGQQVLDVVKDLYTNPMTNTNRASNAVDNFINNYQQGQQIGTAIVGIIDLFTPTPEQIKIREEKAKAAAEKKILIEKAVLEGLNNYTDTKYLEKFLVDAEDGDENIRMILILEIYRKSSIKKDVTLFLPKVKNWIDEAVKNKNLDAMNFIGYYAIHEQKRFDSLNYTKDEGIKILEEAVNLNSADAMFTLGRYYDNKWEGNDPEKGFYFYTKAAQLNLPQAMYELGKIYVNNNSKQMLKIYKIKKEDNLGCTYIQNSLSIDYSESLYEKYATYNKSFVKFRVYKELALMYESGLECPMDKEMAKKLYAESDKSLYEFSMKNVK